MATIEYYGEYVEVSDEGLYFRLPFYFGDTPPDYLFQVCMQAKELSEIAKHTNNCYVHDGKITTVVIGLARFVFNSRDGEVIKYVLETPNCCKIGASC